MQQDARQAHAPFTLDLKLLSTIIIHLVAQPPLPEIRRKARMIVPRGTQKIVLSLVGEDRHARPATCTVTSVVEDGSEVLRRPFAVDEDGVRRVYGFETVVQGARCGPHFAEHGVSEAGLFAMHRLQQAPGEATGRVDSGTTRWKPVLLVVSRDIISQDPIRLIGVEEWVEDDEVSGFTDTPFVLVFCECGVGFDIFVNLDVGVVLGRLRAPDVLLRLLHLWARDVGVGREMRGPSVGLAVGAVFGLHTDHLLEVFPGIVHRGDIETCIAFPEAFAGLGGCPFGDLFEEVVVVACVAHVHFPVPEEVELGVLVRKVRHGHECRAVGTMDRQSAVVGLFHSAVNQAHLAFRPQRAHAGELGGQRVLEDLGVDVFVGPDLLVVVLYVDKEVDFVFTAGCKAEFGDEGAEVHDVFVVVLVVPPCANEHGGPWKKRIVSCLW